MANKPTPADFSPTVPDFPVIGQYQPIYGKFDLTTYIQGASDYEIMSFLVQCYNSTLKGYSDVTQLSKDTVTAFNQLQTWVNTWFDELDVQQEINNKLQAMYEAGTLSTAIAQSNAIPPAVAQYLNSVEGTKNLSDVTANKIEEMAKSGALGTVINNTGTVQSTTTNWLQENVTPVGSAVTVDKSLTIEESAADSKETGNAIQKTLISHEIVMGSASGEYTGDTLFGNLNINQAYFIWKNALKKITDIVNLPPDVPFLHVMPMGNSWYNRYPNYGDTASYISQGEQVSVLLTGKSTMYIGFWMNTTKQLVITNLIAPLSNNLNTSNLCADSKITGNEISKAPVFKEVVLGSQTGTYSGETLFGNLKVNTAYFIWENALNRFTDIVNPPNDTNFIHIMPMGNRFQQSIGLDNIPTYLSSGELQTVIVTTRENMFLGWWSNSTHKLTITEPFFAGKPNEYKENNFISMSAFPKIGVVGDSFASGQIHVGSASANYYSLSWPQELARMCGVSAFNFSKGGLTTATWLTDTDYGLPKLLSTEKQNLYMIALGINDNGLKIPVGTIYDIKDDYNDNPATFYGNMGKIIDQIKNYADKAKLVMITTPVTYTPDYNTAIIEIASHYKIPCLISNTDEFFNSEFYKNSMRTGHPTALSYSGMALAYQRLFNLTARNFITYFADYTGQV